jgi:4-amino-4-deoxychorismate lyase
VQAVWLVNGQPSGVDPADRGLAYGDGLFETMAARDGSVRWLELHLDRLIDGCHRLAIPPPERSVIEAEVAAHCPQAGRATIKLIVTRGPGNRGYAPPESPRPTRVLAVSSWPDYPLEHYEAGIRVRVCRLRLGENPALAGLKHLNRLEQVLAQLELRGSDAQQGLLLDSADRVVGGSSSNVFAVRSGRLLTPALERAGVKGVMRRAVLAAAARLGIESAECDLSLAELLSADELFMTNALFGIWPVAVLDERRFAPGTVTRRLMRHLEYGSHA